MWLIDKITENQIKSDIPQFRAGDKLRVHVRIEEGTKERIQIFEGFCLKRQHSGTSASFTVRKISYGVGVERTFPLNSPLIGKIEVVERGRVRRAKLFYTRDRVGKAAKIKPLLKK